MKNIASQYLSDESRGVGKMGASPVGARHTQSLLMTSEAQQSASAPRRGKKKVINNAVSFNMLC